MKKMFCFCICIGFALLSCNNRIDEKIYPQTSNVYQEVLDSPLNQTMKDVAWTVSKAMAISSDFRQVVKLLAAERFDGDYDVLLKHLQNKRISDFQSTRGVSDVTVSTLFNELFPVSAKSSTQENILEMLAQMYPTMQISVPVNIDKWEEGYIPTVVFVDETFKDTVTEYVLGYDASGNEVWVDAINEPDKPVVVVGFNERIGSLDDDNLTTKAISGVTLPSTPVYATDFTATLEGGFIRLSWGLDGVPWNILVFCSVNNGLFTQVGTTTGTSYIYDNIDTDTTYKFYLKVQNLGAKETTTTPTRTVTTSDIQVQPLTSFHAAPINDMQTLLTWEQNTANTNDYVQIYRRELADSSITGLGTLVASISNSNIHQYLDEDAESGKKYIYTAMNAKDGCVSNYKYDTIWKPYRNCSQADSVYIKSIYYDSANYRDDIESWVYGAPEFRVSVHTIPGETTTPSTRVNGKFLYFDDREQNFKAFYSENYLFSWLPVTTYDCMTIYISEWDRETATEPLSFSVGVGFKVPLGDDIVPVNATVNININADDIPIGFGHTYYYEEQVQTMYLENFGFAVTISNTNSR